MTRGSLPTERAVRLCSGLVIASFVALHLLNHTLGLVSLDAMERFRPLNAALWQNPVGTVALYGAFAAHAWLALRSLYRRRTLRMPAWEAVQLGLGLLVPFLLAGHVIGTRVTQALLGFDVDYPYVVTTLWNNPWYRAQQTVLVIVVWTHAVIGLHFWLRLRAWYPRALPYLYAAAVLVPVLALLGFAAAGARTEQFAADPKAREAVMAGWLAAAPGQRATVRALKEPVLWTFGAVLAGVLGARAVRAARERRRGAVRVRYGGRRVIDCIVGRSLLEALRAARVSHASVCGGRARCTTCRVLVTEGLDSLPAPRPIESAALARISAPPNVRLACQLCPVADLDVAPLVPAERGLAEARRPGGVRGREQAVAVLFLDLRGSTALGESHLPYDVVWILNEFFAEMSAALEATGGHYAQFSGDGLMALYGLRTDLAGACRDALAGAVQMSRRLERLNARLHASLPAPLRIGIGVHAGEAIVGTMGPPSSPNLSAIGDTVNIAARLEQQCKVYGCALVVSAETAAHAGVDLAGFPRHDARVRGRDAPIGVYALDEPRALEGLLAAPASPA